MKKTTKKPQNNFGMMQREMLKYVKGNDLTVFIALLSYSDKYATCFPSVETLANDTGITSRNVQKYLANLEAAGWIDRNYRTNTSTMYQLYFIDTSKAPKKTAKGVSKSDRASKSDVSPLSKSDRSGVSDVDVSGVSKSDVLTDQLTDQNNRPQEQAVVVTVPVVNGGVDSATSKYKLTSAERSKFEELWASFRHEKENKGSTLSAWKKYCSYQDPELLVRIENWLDNTSGTYMSNQMKQISEVYFDEKVEEERKAKLKSEGKLKTL